tara:strand:+ start:2268 stop:2648 length:381 start_codon:yes stop_codon:yes gene_type:complete
MAKKNVVSLEERVVTNVENTGCNVVMKNDVIVDISQCPSNNFEVAKTKRRYFYPGTGNWVSYMRARRLLKERGIDIFKLPENNPEVKKVDVEEIVPTLLTFNSEIGELKAIAPKPKKAKAKKSKKK